MKMATGSNIRTLRNLAGLTLEQLSVLSGVEVGTISALENRDSARSKYFTAIAQAFGISTDDLSSEITSDQLERAAQMQYQMRGDDIAAWPSAQEVAQSVFDRVESFAKTPAKTIATPGDHRLPIRRAMFKLSAGVSGYFVDSRSATEHQTASGRFFFAATNSLSKTSTIHIYTR